MNVNEEILIAYSQCKLKSYYLLSGKKRKKSHEFSIEIDKRRHTNLNKNICLVKNDLYEGFDETPLIGKSNRLVFGKLNSEYDFFIKRKTKSKNIESYSLEPVYFSGVNKPSQNEKMRLAFIGYIFSKIKNIPIKYGLLILFNSSIKRINLLNLYPKIEEILLAFKGWSNGSTNEPLLIINKHCELCCFRNTCLKNAKTNYSLSLLSRINNEKLIKQYQKKGIFNIKQLACLYRPKRRKKKAKKTVIKHNLELQALAINEKKIYVKEEPNLIRKDIELFLDVETIPDEDFCYLIGVSVRKDSMVKHYHYWAESIEKEKQNFIQVTTLISQYSNAPIYHYGNYDEKIIRHLGTKYDVDLDNILINFINLNSYIFGKIYFPLYSNNLKEIAQYLGLKNESKISSGLESLIYRYKWERVKKESIKNELIEYNRFDCNSLLHLVKKLSQISNEVNAISTINLISQPKKNATQNGSLIHSQIETILRMGHENYNNKKIILRDEKVVKTKPKIGGVYGHIGKTRIRPKSKKEKRLTSLTHCPIHKSKIKYFDNLKSVVVTDLVFTKNGIRKTAIKYVYEGGFCKKCKKKIFSEEVLKLRNQFFGHNFKSWIVYQRVYLRLPHRLIRNFTNVQFNETISEGSITSFMKTTAKYYLETEKLLEQEIKNSSFVHIDETTLNIKGIDYYVWTFTDSKNVIFKLTLTREADLVHEFLKDYKGVLISDFYPGYDSINCKQQKCWVHMLRDINDDLWKHPFDSEFEKFVSNFRDLFVPIFKAIQKFGLKKYHFNKFIPKIKKYYESQINGQTFHSELCQKYQKRFIKFEYALFTFLYHDEIPWNNNTGERALRHLAVQRKISGYFSKNGAKDYLRFLGIMQSCRFQNKCFLKFMLSGLIDIDEFKRKKKTTPNI